MCSTSLRSFHGPHPHNYLFNVEGSNTSHKWHDNGMGMPPHFKPKQTLKWTYKLPPANITGPLPSYFSKTPTRTRCQSNRLESPTNTCYQSWRKRGAYMPTTHKTSSNNSNTPPPKATKINRMQYQLHTATFLPLSSTKENSNLSCQTNGLPHESSPHPTTHHIPTTLQLSRPKETSQSSKGNKKDPQTSQSR